MGTATDKCGLGESKLSKEMRTFETPKFVNMKPPERENSNEENDRRGLGESKLSNEMLTFETPKFVNMKPPERGNPNEENHSQMIALGDETRNTGQLRVMELSNVDQMYDYYMRIALFYDVCKSKHGVPGCKDLLNAIDSAENGPVRRLEAALEELLLHYPAAAGQVCYNEHKARLEIHYYDGLPTTAVGTTGDDGDDGWRGGVRFITAHANIALKELGDPSVPNPSLDLLYPNPTFGARLPGQNGNVSERYLTRPVTVIQLVRMVYAQLSMAYQYKEHI